MDLIAALSPIVQYVVLPVAAFVWATHVKVQAHRTEIAVINSELKAIKEARDRAETGMMRTIEAIFAKLDSIEAALRK